MYPRSPGRNLPCVNLNDAVKMHLRRNAASSSRRRRNPQRRRRCKGRPRKYSIVLSSTATMPERAPASIDMLHSVIRPSGDDPRMVLPANSIAWPVPPAVPITPITCRITSLAVQPASNGPSTRTSIFLFFLACSVCVAMTCSTSEVPIPNASAPTAPWVDVCESPQTTVIPGSVAPCSGPMTCTMPWRRSFMRNSVTPCFAQLASSVSTCNLETGSEMPSPRSIVGTL